MLEYFTYKKVKKHQAEKRAESQVQTPLISEEDENFLTHIVSAEGTPPPLPERPRFGPEAGDSTGNQSQMVIHSGNQEFMEQSEATGRGSEKEKEDEQPAAKKSKRFSFLHRSHTKKDKLKPTGPISPSETSREEDDINRVLDDLNLAAVNNRAFSFSAESQQIVQKFTVILKDLVNGVPTAYDDLVHLLDDSQGTLAKSYDHLPSFLKKLVTQLPDKLTKNLAPELLAVAAEAQALSGNGGAGKGGLAGAAKGFFKINTLKDIVTKPGAVVSLLKYILNVLKLRWPAFMGTNVLLSLGLFVLLFFFWYCHKRGREVRIEKERTVDSDGRVIELDDDPMLDGGPSSSRIDQEHRHDSSAKARDDRDHRRENAHSSSSDHGRSNGAVTPSRKERRSASSRDKRRPRSSEASAGERREDDTRERRR